MGGAPPPLRHTPCACTGSLGSVHDECLQQARAASPLLECPVCRTPFSEPELRDATVVMNNSSRRALLLLPVCALPAAVFLFIITTTQNFFYSALCSAATGTAAAAVIVVAMWPGRESREAGVSV